MRKFKKLSITLKNIYEPSTKLIVWISVFYLTCVLIFFTNDSNIHKKQCFQNLVLPIWHVTLLFGGSYELVNFYIYSYMFELYLISVKKNNLNDFWSSHVVIVFKLTIYKTQIKLTQNKFQISFLIIFSIIIIYLF